MNVVVDVLVRSYFRDATWLRLCLAALHQFVDGYREVVLVVPRSSVDRIPADVVPPGLPLRWAVCRDHPDDYVGQQWTKLEADRYTDADFIAHLDSDCVFLTRASMARFFVGGRPVHVFRDRSSRHARDGWRRSVERCLGYRTEREFMVALPAVYPRWIYAELRNACSRRLSVSLQEYVLSLRGDEVSEFNLLGAHAWHSHHEAFSWIDVEKLGGWPCRAFWSRAGLTAEVRSILPVELQDSLR